MNVAERIIARFGGSARLARMAGYKHASRVNNWKKLGHVPATEQRHVLRTAQENGIELGPADFFDEEVAE